MASGSARLVRAPETSAAGRAALGTQGWGLRPMGGRRSPTARRGRPALGVQPELQPGPRGDRVRPQPGSHLVPGTQVAFSAKTKRRLALAWSKRETRGVGVGTVPQLWPLCGGEQEARFRSGRFSSYSGAEWQRRRKSGRGRAPRCPQHPCTGGNQLRLPVSASGWVEGDVQVRASSFATPSSLKVLSK